MGFFIQDITNIAVVLTKHIVFSLYNFVGALNVSSIGCRPQSISNPRQSLDKQLSMKLICRIQFLKQVHLRHHQKKLRLMETSGPKKYARKHKRQIFLNQRLPIIIYLLQERT